VEEEDEEAEAGDPVKANEISTPQPTMATKIDVAKPKRR